MLEVDISNVRPLYSRLLVKVLEEKETASGILIAGQKTKRRTVRGEVIATGDGYREVTKTGVVIRPVSVNVGDIVVFQRFGGDQFADFDDQHLIIDESYVLATERNGARSDTVHRGSESAVVHE